MENGGRRPLLSIVIPTRGRGLYLKHSLNAAVACKDPRIEILVSDNASEDNTAAVVAEQRDKRVRYVRTPRRGPVSDSFEFAFSNATGQYILYRGDDDAVLPGGIRDLLVVLQARAPDIVAWPEIDYLWPGESAKGFIKIKRRQVEGGFEEQDRAELMRAICSGERGAYSVFLGCVSRDLVESVTSIAGRYFYHSAPDSTGFGSLACAKSVINLHRPVTVFGRSPASTSISTTTFSAAASNSNALYVMENAGAAPEGLLDVRSRSLWAQSLDGLMLTRRIFALSSPPINFDKWRERIVGEVVGMPEPFRTEQTELLNPWLGRNGMAPVDLAPTPASAPSRPRGLRKRKIALSSITLPAEPGFLDNVEAAASVAEAIIGPAALSSRPPRPIALLRWLGAMARASRRTGRAPIA